MSQENPSTNDIPVNTNGHPLTSNVVMNNRGAILLVDFKLTENNEMQVVEFGCGTNSTFTAYDRIFSDPSEHLMLKTLSSIATKFDQVACVNGGIEDDSPWSSCINQFINILSNHNNIQQENNTTILSSLVEDKKVAIIHYATESKLAFWQGAILAEKVAAKNLSNPPVIMNGSAAISFMAEDKVLYSKFANESKCELKPQDQLLHFDLCSDTDIDKTIQKISKYPVVIKATNSSGGKGALVANNKEHAQLLLSAIKNRKYDTNQLKLSDAETEAMDFWLRRTRERDRFCLIQQYVAGQIVNFDDKPYEPTGRLVFYFCDINNERYFEIVGGYWKFTRKSKNQGQRTVEDTISYILETKEGLSNSAIIDSTIMTIIKNQFEKKVTPLLDHVFQVDPTKMLLEMLTGDNILERQYALTELPDLTKSFYGLLEHIDKKFVWEYIFNTLEEISLHRYHSNEINSIFYQVSKKYSHLDKNGKKRFLNLLYVVLDVPCQDAVKYNSIYHQLLRFLAENDHDNFVNHPLSFEEKLITNSKKYSSEAELLAEKSIFSQPKLVDHERLSDSIREKIEPEKSKQVQEKENSDFNLTMQQSQQTSPFFSAHPSSKQPTMFHSALEFSNQPNHNNASLDTNKLAIVKITKEIINQNEFNISVEFNSEQDAENFLKDPDGHNFKIGNVGYLFETFDPIRIDIYPLPNVTQDQFFSTVIKQLNEVSDSVMSINQQFKSSF